MLLSGSDTINVTATLDGSRNPYQLPATYQSMDSVVFSSSDGTVYNPNFTDYTVGTNNQWSVPGTYDGTFVLNYEYSSTTPSSSSSFNYFDMQQEATRQIGVASKGILPRLPANYIKDELNKSQKEVAIQLLCVPGQTPDITTIIGNEQYDLASNYIENTVSRVTYNGYPLECVDESYRDYFAPNYTTGIPVYFYLRGRVIGLLPRPSEAKTLIVEHATTPADMVNDTDVSGCPEVTYTAITKHTAYKALAYMNNPAATDKWNEYVDALDDARKRLKQTPKGRITVVGGKTGPQAFPHRLRYPWE